MVVGYSNHCRNRSIRGCTLLVIDFLLFTRPEARVLMTLITITLVGFQLTSNNLP